MLAKGPTTIVHTFSFVPFENDQRRQRSNRVYRHTLDALALNGGLLLVIHLLFAYVLDRHFVAVLDHYVDDDNVALVVTVAMISRRIVLMVGALDFLSRSIRYVPLILSFLMSLHFRCLRVLCAWL